MLKQILHKYLHHRHHWRKDQFNELNEIYVVMLVRGMSLSMMGLFIPIYMYQIGYDLTQIVMTMVFYFFSRVFADLFAGVLVARFGPKHIIVVGQLMFIVTALLFLSLKNIVWPLAVLGGVWGISQSLFSVAFDTDFSKVKHTKHSGKELGYILIMSKLGALLGPVLGGLIGYLIGGKYIFLIASITMMLGMLPLFKTKEPTKIHQKFVFNKLSLKKSLTIMPAMIGEHIDNTLTITLWPLFIAIFILPGKSAFLNVGIITSISVAISILAYKRVGEMADLARGRNVLRFSVFVNVILHAIRPLTSSYFAALAVNVTNDVTKIGFKIPLLKAYFDLADDYQDQRIVFLAVTESILSFTKMIAYCVIAVATVFLSDKNSFILVFALAGLASTIILSEKINQKPYNRSKEKLA